jgi:hypothetical protein
MPENFEGSGFKVGHDVMTGLTRFTERPDLFWSMSSVIHILYDSFYHIVEHNAKTQYRKFEQKFLEKELRGLSPKFHIHASMSNLYIPMIGLPTLFCCRKICGSILGIYKSLADT